MPSHLNSKLAVMGLLCCGAVNVVCLAWLAAERGPSRRQRPITRTSSHTHASRPVSGSPSGVGTDLCFASAPAMGADGAAPETEGAASSVTASSRGTRSQVVRRRPRRVREPARVSPRARATPSAREPEVLEGRPIVVDPSVAAAQRPDRVQQQHTEWRHALWDPWHDVPRSGPALTQAAGHEPARPSWQAPTTPPSAETDLRDPWQERGD